MANQYEEFIEETRWGLDSKESQQQALYQKFLSLYNPYNPTQQNMYVQELIKQFEDILELYYLVYENSYNDHEVIGYGD